MTKKKEITLNTEAEVVDLFCLNKLQQPTDLMQELINITPCIFNDFENTLFNRILHRAAQEIRNWSEEDLKMYFITYIVELSNLSSTKNIRSFFDKSIAAKVNDVYLRVKPDFTMALGIMDLIKSPYFHFHEYKKEKESTRDPLGQLLQAFLIAQEINQNEKPLYGAYIMGRFWYFVVYENNKSRDYSVSRAYDSTEKNELINIISILRNFRIILETKLIH